MDNRFIEMNLQALKKARNKFDVVDGVDGVGRVSTMQIDLDNTSPERFQVRLESHLESMGYVVAQRIRTRKERSERLFDELQSQGLSEDTDLDEKSLYRCMEKLKLPCSRADAQELLAAADRTGDGIVSLSDFREFVVERERTIRDIFTTLDANREGSLGPKELLMALHMLDIDASKREVEELIERTHQRRDEHDHDHDHTHDHSTTSDQFGHVSHYTYTNPSTHTPGRVDYATFRELLVLVPETDPKSLFEYWQQAVDFEFGHPDETNKSAFLETFIAGGIAGAVSRTCTAPLDRLKLLLQTDSKGKYRGILQGLRTIYEEGKQHRVRTDKANGKTKVSAKGWRGALGGAMAFFRGNGTNVVKIAPETAIKFWAYESAKPILCKDANNPSGMERFLCGATGGITAQTCIYPLEIVKTRLAVARVGTYKGISHCMFKITRKEGFGALYKGLTASVLGIIPYSGVDMAVYFSLRERYCRETGPLGMMACGAVSSTCGMVCSFPFQLIRTRLQATGLFGMPKYSGIYHCFTDTVRNDGFLGLYKGFGPNMLKALPAISITYTVYEMVKKRLLAESSDFYSKNNK
mmetsp:Transcript_13471/g.24381  ORF Transcript_13471/g.24381 Transcript_13471/m.24381 type:complete len:582 (-) Transcript_13471:318-2063(-)